MDLTAIIPLNKEAVILAGKSDFDPVRISVDPSVLTAEEREEIVRCQPDDNGEFRVDAPLAGPVYTGDVDYLKGQAESYKTSFRMPSLVDVDFDTFRQVLGQRITAYNALCEKFSDNLESWWVSVVNKVQNTPAEMLLKELSGGFNRHLQLPFKSIDCCEDLMERVHALNSMLEDVDQITTVRVTHYIPAWKVGSNLHQLRSCPDWLLDNLPQLRDKLEAVDKLADEKTHSPDNIRKGLERVISLLEGRLKRQRERKAEDERAAAIIAAWVEEHGDESQKARYAEGLLPENEVLDAMRNALFEPLAGFERFKRLHAEDFCRCDWFDEDSIEYESGTAESASKREYETLGAIRQVAANIQKDAVVELRYHRGECARCEKSKTVKSVRVKLRHGPFEFTREYACPQPEKV